LEAGLAFEVGTFEPAVAVAFDLGLEVAFFDLDSPVTALLAGAFFAVLAFLAGFFAVAGLAFVVVDLAFFADDVYFLAVGVVLVLVILAVLGLVAVVEVLVVLAFKGFLTVVLFLTVVTFFVVLGLDLEVASFLTAGLAFSFAASLCCTASLTFPEGPLGRTKVPFSAP